MALKIDCYTAIKRLLEISKRIKLDYDKLIALEINDQKGNDEYLRLLGEIEILRKKEDYLYNNCIFKSRQTASAATEFLLNQYDGELLTNIDTIIYRDEDCLEIKRLIDRSNAGIFLINHKEINKLNISDDDIDDATVFLEDYFYNNNYYSEYSGYDCEYDEIGRLLSALRMQTVNIENNKEIIEEHLEKDIINYFIYLIEEEINKQTNKEIRDSLIKVKYYTSFMCSDIETDLLKNMFCGNDYTYRSAKTAAVRLNIPLHFYDYVEYGFISSNFYCLISTLYSMTNELYEELDKEIMAILIQLLIKAYSNYVPSDIIDELANDKRISDEMAFYVYGSDEDQRINNSISKRKISETFADINKRKNKQKIISIGGLYR